MITYEQINNILGPAPEWSFLDSCYDARLESRDTLLITIGDSWTWGDSLGQAKARESRDDPEYRLKHIYGNLIANKLNADWINVAIPGESNTWMVEKLSELLDSGITKHYSQTYITVTLTELGRKDDYFALVKHKDTITTDTVFATISQEIHDKINLLKDNYPEVKIVVGYNFVDPVPNNKVLPDTWLDLLYKDNSMSCHIVLSEHITILCNWLRELTTIHKFEIRNWELGLIERSLARVNRLDNSKYNNTEDSRHPTEDGHAIWAEHLFDAFHSQI